MRRVSLLAALVTASVFAVAPTLAQKKSTKPAPVQKDCVAVHAASGASRVTNTWAKKTARDAWRREVKAQHGEQYQEIQYAKDEKYRCSSTGAGLQRCTVTATPCRVPEEKAKKG